MTRKIYIISGDELIQSYRNGIKLIKPNDRKENDGLVNVSSLFNLPCNIGLMNSDIEIVGINETTTCNNGFLSPKDAIGKNAFDMTNRESASMLVQHDANVMINQRMNIFEEAYEYNGNDFFSCIAFKLPWYSEEGKIIGIFFFAINSKNQSQTVELLDKSKLDFFKNNMQIKRILQVAQLDGIPLCRRHTECLYLLIRGKTAKEIGKVLNISPKSAECYIMEMRHKFGGISKSQLIEKAVESDFINVIPATLVSNVMRPGISWVYIVMLIDKLFFAITPKMFF